MLDEKLSELTPIDLPVLPTDEVYMIRSDGAGGFTNHRAEVGDLPGADVAAEDVTYDNTISGLTAADVKAALDELAAAVAGTIAAEDVTYDNTISGLTAADVKAALDELAAAVAGAIAAEDVTYDNTISGLTATDVKAALDELAASLGGATAAEDVTYDNATSGLAATDAQAAIDELAAKKVHFCWSFNPKAVCDGTLDRLFLMTVGPDFPNGLKITRWNVSFDADPATEADLDFKRADAFIGVANAAVVDVLDTTAGVSSETTEANINAGVAVANGKVLYLEFGTAYTVDNLQIVFEFWGYAV